MQFLTYAIYSSLWWLIRFLPEKFAYGLFSAIGKYAYRRGGKRVQRLRQNFQVVKPDLNDQELEKLVQQGLQSAMRYWCDTFRISDWNEGRVQSNVITHDAHYLFDPIREGRGLIVALPHAGNWDHAGAYFCSQGIRVNTVAEHLKPERLFRKFLIHRQKMGMRVLDINAGVLNQLEEILNSGELVALVADRDLSKSGVNVEFFGKTARMPAGPALLALKTKADLITAFVAYTKDGIEIYFSPPIQVNRDTEEAEEISRITQVVANHFANSIAKHPTSWHMQQRIFIDHNFVERM